MFYDMLVKLTVLLLRCNLPTRIELRTTILLEQQSSCIQRLSVSTANHSKAQSDQETETIQPGGTTLHGVFLTFLQLTRVSGKVQSKVQLRVHSVCREGFVGARVPAAGSWRAKRSIL